ncbi:MAG TPA: CDF family Co(II)/Ni(II) efflux transporter DmeF [Pseudolabrys sp.]|jgi:cation diffusion facilitator family transporter|nr:CDF family Co(II)/Ni(II) efflux transporter DmeF [Pseudolabrys sp.]
MHNHSLEGWQHSHVFLGAKHNRHERRTWFVVALTAAMMVAEIVGGTLFGSMAVVADGWHMSTHAGALAIAALAYRLARRYAQDTRFTFGTGKIGELAAFASAVILALIAALIGYEASTRLYAPVAIDFSEATWLAVAGLAVNLASAWLLFDGDHDHGHEHTHGHGHSGGHHHHHDHDTNLRAAYVHVLADALTSVLAIAALLAGRFFGWVWMDPAMALVGVGVILAWSVGLIRASGAALLDMVPDRKLVSMIRTRLEVSGDRVSDLHLWRLGPGHVGLIAAVISDRPKAPAVYKRRLQGISGLSHVTIEVHACEGHAQKAA